MTPGEKNIVKSLVAVAWADGRMERSEASVIEGLLSGFDATADEETELLAYASVPRSLEDDIPLSSLSAEERELLFANAALLILADGVETPSEQSVLGRLGVLLELGPVVQDQILDSVRRASTRPSR